MRHKIGLYIRVSTDEQAFRHEGSIENQQHRLKAFIDMKNMHEAGWGKAIETYIDDGYSAKDTNRPAFQRMMKDICRGKINMIFVTDLSRLSRNIKDFCFLLEDLQKAKARFLSIKEQFDTTTAAGEMMIFNLMNLAQFERKQTSERVSINFFSRALRGLRNGGAMILGYDKNPTNPSSLMINEKEAADVQTIFSMFTQIGSLGKLATELNQTMIAPKKLENENYRHNARGKWNPQSLHNLLRNPAYVGLREINKGNKDKEQETLLSHQKFKIVKASWPAIIDQKTFDDAQEILKSNTLAARTRKETGESRIYLLSGIIKCSECGRALVGNAGHGKISIHRYYVHRRIHGEKVNCAMKSIRADDLEQEVLKYLDNILSHEGYLQKIENRIIDLARPIKVQLKNETELCLVNLDQVDKDIKATFELHTKMGDSVVDSLFKERLQDLQSQKKFLSARLTELQDQKELSLDSELARQTIQENLAHFQKAKKNASRFMLKQLIKKVLAGIVLEPNRIAIRYWTGNELLDSKPTPPTKKASDLNSEASIIQFPCTQIQNPFSSVPTFGVKEVVGSDIIKHGRADWS